MDHERFIDVDGQEDNKREMANECGIVGLWAYREPGKEVVGWWTNPQLATHTLWLCLGHTVGWLLRGWLLGAELKLFF